VKPVGKKRVAGKTPKSKQRPEPVYLDDQVKDFSFAEFVKLQSGPRGMLFSFGKGHPEVGNIVIFKEIMLPYDVAATLSGIIASQLEQLKAEGLIEIHEADINKVKK